MQKTFEYPYRGGHDPALVSQGSLRDVAGTRFKYLLKGIRNRRPGITLDPVSRPKPAVPDNAIILICVLRNAAYEIPQFLAYHRRLGVDRFAIVDDASDDGSAALLDGQEDVDLYRSNARYREANHGRVWRDMVVRRYGVGRWYMVVDSDEYLVFPGSENTPIRDLTDRLTKSGVRHFHAPMIDIYPEGPLDGVSAPADPEQMPTVQCPLFDTDSYSMKWDKRGMVVRGGPRYRLFDQQIRMTKFPLIFADRHTRMNSGSSHLPMPHSRNYVLPGGVLLHNKFSCGAVQRFEKFVGEKAHVGGSMFYKQIVDHPTFHADMDLSYEGSAAYENPAQLQRMGFFQSF